MNLKHLEEKIESSVEGFFGSLFRGRVQPTEIARRLEREMEEQKVVTPQSLVAPNVFTVALHPDDKRALDPALAVVVPELAAFVAQCAAEKSFRLPGEVSVRIVGDAELKRGTMHVDSQMLTAASEEARVARPGTVDRSLLFRDGTRHGEVYELTKDVTIGREEDADLRLDERAVSRQHARLTWNGEHTIVEDLGSTNGTFVNGQRITRCALKAGDVIRIGTRSLEYRVVRTL